MRIVPSAVPAVKDNPVTHEKVELGKALLLMARKRAHLSWV